MFKIIEQEIKQKLKNNENINWDEISIHKQLSEEFIREYKDYVDWFGISQYQQLSEEFIREFKDYVNWNFITKHQQLSEEFIREFKDKISWRNISQYQQLSEEFIKEFKDKISWVYISMNQNLSEEFILEFEENLDRGYISEFQNLSEEFLEEFKDYININKYRESHIEKPYHQKKEEVVDYCKINNLYYNNEYFIAYKPFERNNKDCSLYNYIKCYLPNIYYRNWRIDSNKNHILSFGYDISGRKVDKNYKKIKVKIEDWGTIINVDHYHARTKGFMII